jgi:hypothetical protein
MRDFLEVKRPACEAPSSPAVQMYSTSMRAEAILWLGRPEFIVQSVRQAACDSVRLVSGRRQLFRYSAGYTDITTLPIFIADIPLCLIIYRVNKLFIVAVKHNNIFSF